MSDEQVISLLIIIGVYVVVFAAVFWRRPQWTHQADFETHTDQWGHFTQMTTTYTINGKQVSEEEWRKAVKPVVEPLREATNEMFDVMIGKPTPKKSGNSQ